MKCPKCRHGELTCDTCASDWSVHELKASVYTLTDAVKFALNNLPETDDLIGVRYALKVALVEQGLEIDL